MKLNINQVVKIQNITNNIFEPIAICEFKIVKIKGRNIKLICLSKEQDLFTNVDWLEKNIIT